MEKYLYILFVPDCPDNQLSIGREAEADAEHYPPLRETYAGPGGHVASEYFCTTVESSYKFSHQQQTDTEPSYTDIILLPLAQSQHTVLAPLGLCI